MFATNAGINFYVYEGNEYVAGVGDKSNPYLSNVSGKLVYGFYQNVHRRLR